MSDSTCNNSDLMEYNEIETILSQVHESRNKFCQSPRSSDKLKELSEKRIFFPNNKSEKTNKKTEILAKNILHTKKNLFLKDEYQIKKIKTKFIDFDKYITQEIYQNKIYELKNKIVDDIFQEEN